MQSELTALQAAIQYELKNLKQELEPNKNLWIK